jgi:hypothetical protein
MRPKPRSAGSEVLTLSHSSAHSAAVGVLHVQCGRENSSIISGAETRLGNDKVQLGYRTETHPTPPPVPCLASEAVAGGVFLNWKLPSKPLQMDSGVK